MRYSSSSDISTNIVGQKDQINKKSYKYLSSQLSYLTLDRTYLVYSYLRRGAYEADL
jgi:hypothetical protein